MRGAQQEKHRLKNGHKSVDGIIELQERPSESAGSIYKSPELRDDSLTNNREDRLIAWNDPTDEDYL